MAGLNIENLKSFVHGSGGLPRAMNALSFLDNCEYHHKSGPVPVVPNAFLNSISVLRAAQTAIEDSSIDVSLVVRLHSKLTESSVSVEIIEEAIHTNLLDLLVYNYGTPFLAYNGYPVQAVQLRLEPNPSGPTKLDGLEVAVIEIDERSYDSPYLDQILVVSSAPSIALLIDSINSLIRPNAPRVAPVLRGRPST